MVNVIFELALNMQIQPNLDNSEIENEIMFNKISSTWRCVVYL
jgi:hypothetical protein